MDKIIVACVYRSGGVYTPGDVQDLMQGVYENANVSYTTVCITDKPEDVRYGLGVDEVIPMHHAWPKWWGKIELFRPGVFAVGARVFYIDLDTIICGNLDDLLGYAGDFCMLSDFYKPGEPASGLMAWKAGQLDHLYNIFMPNAQMHMERHRGFKGGIGDQGYIKHHLQIRHDRWQDLYPRQVVSYKVHCKTLNKVPEDARIVCFHGRPKPCDVQIV